MNYRFISAFVGFVHQTRLALIACLIAFGLPGSSFAQGTPVWAPDRFTSVAYSPDGGTLIRSQGMRTLWRIHRMVAH